MSSLSESPEHQAFRRFIAETVELRSLEARVKELKNSRRASQPSLLAYMTAARMPSLTLDGYLLSTHREPWVYPVQGISRQQVCDALKLAGLGRMVKENYSTASLTEHVKQLEERARLLGEEGEGEADPNDLRQLLHPVLADIVRVEAAFSIHVREQKKGPYAQYERTQNTEGNQTDDEDD